MSEDARAAAALGGGMFWTGFRVEDSAAKATRTCKGPGEGNVLPADCRVEEGMDVFRAD